MEEIKRTEESEDKEKLPQNTEVAVSEESDIGIIVIKPDAFDKKDEIHKIIRNSGLHIVKSVTKKLPLGFVLETMYKDLPGGIEDETAYHFASGPSEIILVRGDKETLLQKIVELTGENTDPKKCKTETVRFLFGEHQEREAKDGKKYLRNAVHRAKNKDEQEADLEKFEQWL